MPTERSPLSEFEIRGTWWLPENPQNRVPGTMHYRPGRMVTLETDAPLHELWVPVEAGVEGLRSEPIRADAVLGIGLDHTLCTMMDVVEAQTTVLGRSLLLGAQFKSKAEAIFESAECRLTGLEEWTQISPLVPTLGMLGLRLWQEFTSEPEKPLTVSVPYKKKTLLKFDLPSRGCQLEIGSGIDVSSQGYQSLSITHAVPVLVQPSTQQPLAWYRQFFLDLTRMFSFFLGNPVYRKKTVLYASTADDNSHGGSGAVDLYDEASNVDTDGTPGNRAIALPLILIQGVARQVVEKWFRAAEEKEHLQRLVVETLPPNDSDVVPAFLRLTQALEVLFRQFHVETYVTQQEYDTYYAAIVGAFPSDMPDALKDRLRSYLKFGNEYSLKKAIEHLIGSLECPARAALNVGNPGKLAQLTVNTRNWLTHYGERRDPVISSAREYYQTNRTLRALLFGVLAQSLGLGTPAIQHCIQSVR